MKLAALTFLVALNFAAHAAPVDLGRTTSYTPYDSYMRPVKRVLSSTGGDKSSMERASQLMREGRSFRYTHTDPYNPALPSQTAARRAGDCKDKALWLCAQLDDPSVRFVIGKMKRSASISHAWVMWEKEGQWWILDPTLNSRPIAADRVSRNDYVPLYSYAKNGTYRHSSSSIMTASVAGQQRNAPVASTRYDR